MKLSKCRKYFYVGVQDGIVVLIEKSTVSNQISQLDLDNQSIPTGLFMDEQQMKIHGKKKK